MHRAVCERLGPRTALRFKRHGVYRDLSWADYRRQADWAAMGLIELGVQTVDRIALLSENRSEWLITDHAILSAGAINVPLHAPLAASQVEYQVGHSEARGIVVSSQAQVDKVFEVLDSLPNLEFLISFDPIESPDTSIRTLSWQGLMHRGRQAGRMAVEEIRKREAALTGDDSATIIYTSGTTGNVKGVVLTHQNLITNAQETGKISFVEPDDILLSWLPYSHIYARTVDHYLTTWAGIVVVLAESTETLIDNLAEIQPTWLTAVPRFYEKVWASVERLPHDECQVQLRRIFGPRLKQLTSGGAPLPRHVCEAFFKTGIPLLEGYGLTETSPVISFNNIENHRIGSVGQAIPGVNVKIANDGEILTRGPHVMKEYWKHPEATAEVIVDGWLHTGDVGELDPDGFLTVTDRKKDLIVTSSGKNVAPAKTENLLTSDIYIDQAVAYGDGRQFISALIVPNFDTLKAKVSELNCSLGNIDGFIRTQSIVDFYEERINALMQTVSQPERVRKFLLLARPFHVENDELTSTLKVRRRHIITKYETHLAALYDDFRSPSTDVVPIDSEPN